MHERARTALPLLALALMLPGCMTFEVGANASITEESASRSETVHGSFYGYRWRDYHVQKCDETALALVEYHFNGLQLFASALSLGLYVPQTVEWWCDDPSVVDDDDEPGLDPSDEFSDRATGHTRGSSS